MASAFVLQRMPDVNFQTGMVLTHKNNINFMINVTKHLVCTVNDCGVANQFNVYQKLEATYLQRSLRRSILQIVTTAGVTQNDVYCQLTIIPLCLFGKLSLINRILSVCHFGSGRWQLHNDDWKMIGNENIPPSPKWPRPPQTETSSSLLISSVKSFRSQRRPIQA